MTITAPALESPARTHSRKLYLPALLVAATTAWLVSVAVDTLGRAGSLGKVLSAGRAELVAPAVVVLVATALVCEHIWPAERRPLLSKGHLHDALFLVLHVVAVVPLMTLLGVAFAELLVGHAGWMAVAWTAAWPTWSVLAVTIILMDAGNWLAHFADHRIGALWRFHAVHHSQEELSVLTTFRAHPLSHLAGFFLGTVPVVVLMGHRPMAPAVITAYVCLGTLPHTNVDWSFGVLGKVFVSPAYHRIHHSYEGSRGINLGVVLTVWDVVASRACMPVKGSSPCPTGLPDRPLMTEQDPRSRRHLGLLAGQLAEPFGRR